MTATPETNRTRIAELSGKLDTLKAQVEGEMSRQSDAIESMEQNTQEIKDSLSDFTKKVSKHTDRLYEKSDNHGQRITGVEARLNGHEQLQEVKEQAIRQEITSGFDKLATDLKGQINTMTATAEVKEANEKENKADRKWRIATAITVVIAIIGWLIAIAS